MVVKSSYIQKSTLNGLRYLGTENNKDNRLTRIGWTITIIASCVACVCISFIIRNKYNNTHTITAVVSNTYEISKVPFPSVAICNVNKVSKEKFKRFKNILLQNNVSEEEADAFGKSLGSLITFSTFDYYLYNNETFENVFEILQKYNYSVDTLMKEVQLDCKNLLAMCFKESTMQNCTDLFEMIRTGEGYCCTFNYRGIKNFPEEGSDYISADVKEDPHFLLGYQIFGGLSVIYNIDEEDYLSPTRPIYGINILISDSTDYLDMTATSRTLEVDQRSRVEVTPALVESSSSLSYLSQDDRNCWLTDEIITSEGLYSFRTCMTRCRALAIYKICGCIPFYYPPFGYDLRRKCRLIDNQCLRANQAYFFTVSSNESSGLNCNCKYQCADNFYKVTVYSASIKHASFYKNLKAFYGDKKMNVGLLAVYYPKISCSKFRTDVFMTWNETLALYGGIVNLFIGGSILTLFEIIIYLLMRKYRKFRTRQQHPIQYIE